MTLRHLAGLCEVDKIKEPSLLVWAVTELAHTSTTYFERRLAVEKSLI